MIKPLTYYTIICDNCGKDCNEDQEYSAYGEEYTAREVAQESGWIETITGHYCPSCWGWDENDELLILNQNKQQ